MLYLFLQHLVEFCRVGLANEHIQDWFFVFKKKERKVGVRCVCRQYVCDMLVCSQCVCVCVRLLDFAFFNNSIFEGMKSFSFFCILRLNPYIKDQCICGSAYMCVSRVVYF